MSNPTSYTLNDLPQVDSYDSRASIYFELVFDDETMLKVTVDVENDYGEVVPTGHNYMLQDADCNETDVSSSYTYENIVQTLIEGNNILHLAGQEMRNSYHHSRY